MVGERGPGPKGQLFRLFISARYAGRDIVSENKSLRSIDGSPMYLLQERVDAAGHVVDLLQSCANRLGFESLDFLGAEHEESQYKDT